MADYRRWYVPGGTYFFTVVTGGRAPIFHEPAAVTLLARSMRRVRAKHPFSTLALVVLPDHLHVLWSLPRGDADFSVRWMRIKYVFTRLWIASGGRTPSPSSSQASKGERGLWQRRFWEHSIRDETDLEQHFDYIHFNPVRHGHAMHPAEWPWSMFRRHVRLGTYPAHWGESEPPVPAHIPFE